MTGLTVGSVVETLTFDAFGDVVGRVVTAGGSTLLEVSYVRDALGRIQEKTETTAGETHTEGYGFDLAGRLSDVYRDGQLAAHYEYDENGNRVAKETAAAVLSGVVDAQDRLLSYGALSFSYQGHGALQSRTDTATGATTLYAYDPLGNLRQVALPGGTVIEYRIDYDELGRVVLDTSPGLQPFGFAGGLYDAETRLVRFGARDYDAETGRWTAKDPLLFDGGDTNLYAYALGDPINSVDPTGKIAILLPLITAEMVLTAAMATGAVAAAAWGICELAKALDDDPPSEEDEIARCKKVKQACIEFCSDVTLHIGLHEPHFSRCMRECMEAEGCYQ